MASSFPGSPIGLDMTKKVQNWAEVGSSFCPSYNLSPSEGCWDGANLRAASAVSLSKLSRAVVPMFDKSTAWPSSLALGFGQSPLEQHIFIEILYLNWKVALISISYLKWGSEFEIKICHSPNLNVCHHVRSGKERSVEGLGGGLIGDWVRLPRITCVQCFSRVLVYVWKRLE